MSHVVAAGRARPSAGAGFAAWDPFTEASDAAEGRTTQYLSPEPPAPAARPAAPEDWDPFEDPEMLEVTGELAMQSDDLEAIEAWIEQAQAARLRPEAIQPKRDRAVDLRCRRKDEASRKVLKDKLQEALKGDDRGKLRETIAAAAKAGVAHPRTLDAATRQLEEMRQAEAEFFGKKNAEDAARWEASADDIAAAAIEKVRKAQLVPSVDIELTAQERAALERQARRDRWKKPAAAAGLDAEEVSIRLIFPSGLTETIKARPGDMGSTLLVALLPFRDMDVIPPEFGLFLPGGELLDFTQPLCEQGLQAGGDVRVDDAALGTLEEEEEEHGAPAAEPSAGGGGGGGGGGPASSSLWRFDPENGLPMAIRSQPGSAEGLQTSIVLQPGELLEVSEEQEGPEGMRYLKLADGRGWVFDRKAGGERKCIRHDCGRNEEQLEFELEHRWMRVYWPLTNKKPKFSIVRDALKKSDKVVVLGWNATGDAEVMKMALEVCQHVRGDVLIATGEHEPLVGLPGPPTTSLHLHLSAHAESEELAQSVLDQIRKAGVKTAYAVVVVSASFHSRRLVGALGSCRCTEPGGSATATIIPYCQDPQAMCRADCRMRRLDVLAEAQLLAASDPELFDGAAEAALEELLRKYPTAGRPALSFPLKRQPGPGGAGGGPTGPSREWQQQEERPPPQRPQPQPQAQPQAQPQQQQQQQQRSPGLPQASTGAAAATASQPAAEARRQPRLPRGWECHVDPESGWPYYYHAEWNCWQWDYPTEGTHDDAQVCEPEGQEVAAGAASPDTAMTAGRSIEFSDTDGNAVCFRLTAEGGVDCLVNGELRACSLTQVSVWGGRRINVVGASPTGRGPPVRTSTTVPPGSEALALAVQELSRGR